jgi:hypothetical protein
MCALVLTQIPDSNIAILITTDKLPLVWMDDDIIDHAPMAVVPLDVTSPSIPNLDPAIFRRRDHPLSFTVETYTRNVSVMSLEGQNGIRVRGLDVKELHH